MTPDLAFVFGLAIAGFAVLNALSSLAEQRPQVRAPLLGLIALALIVWAEVKSDAGYTVAGIPAAVVRVVGDFVN